MKWATDRRKPSVPMMWRNSWYAVPVILGLLLAPVPYLLAIALPVDSPKQVVTTHPALKSANHSNNVGDGASKISDPSQSRNRPESLSRVSRAGVWQADQFLLNDPNLTIFS